MDSKLLNTPDMSWIITMLENPESWIHSNGFEQMRETLIGHVQSYYGHGNFKHDRARPC